MPSIGNSWRRRDSLKSLRCTYPEGIGSAPWDGDRRPVNWYTCGVRTDWSEKRVPCPGNNRLGRTGIPEVAGAEQQREVMSCPQYEPQEVRVTDLLGSQIIPAPSPRGSR